MRLKSDRLRAKLSLALSYLSHYHEEIRRNAWAIYTETDQIDLKSTLSTRLFSYGVKTWPVSLQEKEENERVRAASLLFSVSKLQTNILSTFCSRISPETATFFGLGLWIEFSTIMNHVGRTQYMRMNDTVVKMYNVGRTQNMRLIRYPVKNCRCYGRW